MRTALIDGSCCAIINGEFYKRYDCKKGKTPPEGAIACCNPDPVTGHWPHWVKVDPDNPADKWFVAAHEYSCDIKSCSITSKKHISKLDDRTYEAVGIHFQGNPYNLEYDLLVPHGCNSLQFDRTFEGVKSYLEEHEIEGIVFWLNDEPVCKIKRSDFGFKWPIKEDLKWVKN